MKTGRRQPTRRLTVPWPFLYSYEFGRGLVVNLPPLPNTPQKARKRVRRTAK